MSLPKRHNYFPPSIPLSTSLSMPLGSIGIYLITKILVDVQVENLFRSGKGPGGKNGGGSPSEELGPGPLSPGMNTSTRRGQAVAVFLWRGIGIDARTGANSRLEQ
jgi:hypothetical protein